MNDLLSPLPQWAYVVTFAVAAIACLASTYRLGDIEDRETRVGLLALLVTSGLWAGSHVGYLLGPTTGLSLSFYYAGLVFGIAAVGAWLYFCSAYTGRALHRNRAVRYAALATFGLLVAIKLTNPLHGAYFSATAVSEPFGYVEVDHHILHWMTMGFAYSLSTVGIFMLFELFSQVGQRTRSLYALVGLTAMPMLLVLLSQATESVIAITYEPQGVAIFAVGLSTIYFERFATVKLATERDDPVIFLDAAGEIHDFNRAASGTFPSLAGANVVGRPLGELLPAVESVIGSDESVVRVETAAGERYVRVTENPRSVGRTVGTLLTLVDVTEKESYRRELERQNERLEQFASMVSHDLRNPLNVADGRLELARTEQDSEHLEVAANSLDRMGTLIEDVLTLARQGQPIGETEPVSLAAVATAAWKTVETTDATLSVDGDGQFRADRDRLQQAFENLFRNAIEHGGEHVTVTVGSLPDGFYVADDGPGIDPENREDILSFGYSTREEGTGFGLAIVSEIVDAHGWEIAVTEADSGGARFEMTDVEPV